MKLERLQYAKINGPGVTLAYMADDKTHVRRSHFDKFDLMFSSERPLGSFSQIAAFGLRG